MKLSTLTLAAVLLPAAAHAGNAEPLTLTDTLITANRGAQPRDESTAAVSLFTRADIERLRPSSVAELLERVPGVQVVQNGGRGSNTGLFLRGTNNGQTLVLIDGQRIGSVSAGYASLQALSIEQIERVEVLRGSRSALYGADAIGGVVQIFTRRSSGEGLQPRLRLAGGSQGTWERSLGLSGGDERSRFSLAGSLEDTQGIDRTDRSFASDQDHDAYRNRALSLSASHRFDERLEVGLSALEQKGKSEFDNPFGRDDEAFNSFPQIPSSDFVQSSVAGYLDAQFNERWNSRLELGHAEDKVDSYDKLFAGRETFNSYRDSLAWLNRVQLDERHELLLGADYLEDNLRSSTAYDQTERWNQAAFIQHHYRGEQFSSEIGLRHDRNQQYGSSNTWNAALTLPLNPDNSLVLSYAEGFRAPTFNQLYYPASPVFGDSSNPDLAPEQSDSYELQWRSRLGELTRFEASLYRTEIRDLIVYDANANTNQNVSSARIDGFEASLEQQLFGWQANLGLSLINPRDRDSGHTLARRAKRTLNLDLDRQFGAWGAGASWQLVSASFDDAGNRRTLGGYGLLDLRGSWQASPTLALDLTLTNALDKDYSRALYSSTPDNYAYFGYEETPRSLMLGLTWTPAL
ncbi:MAG: TonB-dependent receptor [Pseudomonas sp.]|uniref:TonB-dependent receptor domain-containing protein n=1 Tax=Pseudomonas sp. TaxID=306 RepID=UPI00339A67B8